MTLVEVVAVMGANAALMAAALGVLVALGHVDRQLAQRVNDSQGVAALLDRLHGDIHAVDAVRWDGERQTLKLDAANGATTEYRLISDRAERWSVEPESAGEGANELTSAFRLPGETRIDVEPASASKGDLVRIILSIAADEPRPDRQAPIATEIVAAVGRDGRLLQE